MTLPSGSNLNIPEKSWWTTVIDWAKLLVFGSSVGGSLPRLTRSSPLGAGGALTVLPAGAGTGVTLGASRLQAVRTTDSATMPASNFRDRVCDGYILNSSRCIHRKPCHGNCSL